MEDVEAEITAMLDSGTTEAPEETDWFVWDEEMERYMADVFQLLCSYDE
jgi:hypothetical protein